MARKSVVVCDYCEKQGEMFTDLSTHKSKHPMGSKEVMLSLSVDAKGDVCKNCITKVMQKVRDYLREDPFSDGDFWDKAKVNPPQQAPDSKE